MRKHTHFSWILGMAVGLVLIPFSVFGVLSITSTAAGTAFTAALSGGAGTNLATPVSGPASDCLINIAGCSSNADNWRVDVKRNAGTMPAGISISVKRTGDGTGGGSISGGGAFQSVGTTDASFFSGAGNRTDVPVQVQLDGLSVTIPTSAGYTAALTFTVVDT